MSALPKAVQRQIAEANKIADALVKARNEGEAPPPPDPNAAPPPPAPPVAGQQPAPPAAPIVTPAGAAPPDESWEKKYRVLQGKYNAEVPRLQQESRSQGDMIRTLQSQITATQGMMSAVVQRRESAPAASPSGAPAAPGALVNDAEIKSFGPDLFDFIQRVCRQTVSPMISQGSPQTAQRIEQVVQTVQRLDKKVELSDQQKFHAYLDQHVPGWQEQDANQDFIAWLTIEDPYTGRRRQELLDQAAERLDGPRVAALFKGFQNENAAVTPPAPAPQPAAQLAPPASATPVLERLVAPGTPKTGPAGAPNEAQKRIYTRAEIDEFVHRKNQYVIKGRKVPDALVAEERLMVAAANEGRVSG
jgi:hypothetical protein